MRSEFERLAGASRRDLRLRRMSGLLRMRGVTLIELLTVVVILAILSSIAVASYRRYLVRTNRTEATTMLLRIQVAQEKYFLQNNAYTADVVTAAGLGFGSATTPNGYYTVAVAPAAGGTIATSYVATATAAGTQATSDTQCGTLSITDQGQRGSSPGATSVCWH